MIFIPLNQTICEAKKQTNDILPYKYKKERMLMPYSDCSNDIADVFNIYFSMCLSKSNIDISDM